MSYDPGFDASKYKLYALFIGGITLSYDEEFDAFKVQLYVSFIGGFNA